MRAENRCKEHFQGDKCRKHLRHTSNLLVNPDPVHVGQFNAWTGEGATKTLKGTIQRTAPRRNRVINRIVASAKHLESTHGRDTAQSLLSKVIYYLRPKRIFTAAAGKRG